jgi:hypothetical protein
LVFHLKEPQRGGIVVAPSGAELGYGFTASEGFLKKRKPGFGGEIGLACPSADGVHPLAVATRWLGGLGA